jgi:hypothetical protein
LCSACWDKLKAEMIGAIELKTAAMKADGEWPQRCRNGHRIDR